MLTVDVDKTLGEARIVARFDSGDGATALFGPSGAGKTSIVNMIAGLIAPDRGRILFDGETLFDGTRGIDAPAHRRRIGCVFQDGRLFPHLSVRHNLDYGRWMRGLPRDEIQFGQIVEMLDVGALLTRRPGTLSGGERQRVALGRALLMKPRLLLLDEPLASLDTARKREILPYFERLRDEFALPMIYVSHDAAEVRRVARRVVRIEDGRVTATGGLELLDEAASGVLA